jgi:hypothetical protein
MPYTYDPYDPEERRRREALSGAGMNDVEYDGGASNVLNDGPDEEPDNDPDDQSALGAPVQAGSVVSPSVDRYRQTLANMPSRADYEPSKLRRFGAALAGGLAGMRDAKTGVEVATNIRDQRYNSAQQDWAGNVNRSALEMGLDKQVAAEDIARRRAGAMERNASARERAASATEAWRRSQEANQPWHPKTMDEAIKFEGSKHPAAKLTPFEQYMKDPEGYKKYLADVQAGKTQPLTFEQRKQLQDNATAGRLKVVGAQIAGRERLQKAPKPIMASPLDQSRAEQIALEQVARTNPEYSQFIIKGDKGSQRPARADELGEKHWYGNSEASETTKLTHRKFLMDLERAKRRVLGTTKVVGNAPEDDEDNTWDIQEEDDQ